MRLKRHLESDGWRERKSPLASGENSGASLRRKPHPKGRYAMNRRPIKGDSELEQALAQQYPPEMFSRIYGMLYLNHHPEAPYKRGYNVRMSTMAKVTDENELIYDDTRFYFPFHLLVDDKDRLLNPLGGVKSEWMENDMYYGHPGATFLFGTCKIEPSGACIKEKETTRVSFYVIDGPQRASQITHIMVIRKVNGDMATENDTFWEINRCEVMPSYEDSTYYSRYTHLLKSGERFKMELYPVGFSFIASDDDGDYAWQGVHYKTLADFVKARKDYVRKKCREILQRREDTDITTDLPVATANDDARKKTEGESAEACATGPLHKVPLQTLCKQLNARLERLHGEYGLENLGTYSANPDILAGDGRLSLVRSSTTTYQSRAEALRHVTHLEHTVEAYAKYQRGFEELREEVMQIEGILSTDDIHFAEFEMPQTEPFGPKESPARVVRFSYSARGLAAAKAWLEKEAIEFARCQTGSLITEGDEG